MRRWKPMLSIGLSLGLFFAAPAQAMMIIPPNPSAAAGENQTGPQMPGAAGNALQPGGMTNPSGTAGQNTGPEGSAAPEAGSGQTGGASESISEPQVAAEGAVLMDAKTGQILFGKNQDQQFYPASITKVMTALIVLERCSLNETVTFSKAATTNLESGAVSLNLTEGDQLTVEQALYGLMLKSANEIGNGLAEHVAGSVSAFADLMNARAKELGCTNTHFANPHGLNDSSHKTTPADMARIMSAAVQNETFRKITTTLTYEFPATKKEKARTITMGHKMMYPSDSRYYEGIIGGKTGYTSLAGNTLVTAAERNGVRLVAVVMKAKGSHYTDTKALLDYGFEHYAALTGAGTGNAGGTGTADGSGTAGGTGTAGGSGTGNAGGTETAGGVGPGSAAGTGAGQELSGTGPAGTVQTQESGWQQDGTGWYYRKADGTRAAGEWQTIGGREYWFDTNGYMAVGWRQFTNGDWYYFKESSGMAKSCWIQDQGDWFYLGENGVLLTNTTTPDGYPVNENGIWIQGA